MIFDIFGVLIFLFFLILLGNGFLSLIFASTGLKINNNELEIYALILVGMLALGFVPLIINFFLPATGFSTYAILSILLLIGILNCRKISLISILFLPLLVTLSAPLLYIFDRAGYDGGLYHVPHQLWIRSEKIVFGLSNLHGRFGFGSILEYSSSILWHKEQYFIVAYSIMSFYFAFLLMPIDLARRKIENNALLTLLLAICLNFLLLVIFVRRLHIHSHLIYYSYTDFPATIVFVCAFVYGVMTLHLKEQKRLLVFTALCTFTVMLKSSQVMISFWWAYVMLQFCFSRNASRESAKQALKTISPLLILGCIWIASKIITTGCVIYPITASCLPVAWSSLDNAFNDTNWITAWARHPRSGLYSLDSWDWLWDWWVTAHWHFLYKWFACGLLTILIIRILFKYIGLDRHAARILNRHLAAMICVISGQFLLWFFKAPSLRFGMNVFILIFPVLCVLFFKKKKVLEVRAATSTICALVLCIAAVNGARGFEVNDLVEFRARSLSNGPAVIQDKNFGTRPETGDQCWLAPQCAPYWRPPSQFYGSYRAFVKKNDASE